MKKHLTVRLGVAGSVLLAVACASVGQRTRDYIFGVTGVVTTEDGTPLESAEVILEVRGPVYSGVSPVVKERRITNVDGGFVFMYTSHERAVNYTVTVRKDGFESEAVSGAAPPAGHHSIRLRKVAG